MKRAVLLTVENHLRQYRRLQRRQDREARAWCDAVRETLEEYETGGEPMKARLLVLRYFDGLPWDEVAEAMSYCERHVRRIAESGLAKMSGNVR